MDKGIKLENLKFTKEQFNYTIALAMMEKVSSRKEIVLEHFGMMDNAKYCEKALRKINSYAKNGYILGDNLLVTFESSTIPLDARNVQRMMEKHIKV